METRKVAADSVTVLGIRFFTGTVADAVDQALATKALAVVPAAPALVKLNYDEGYRRALQAAELVIPDSALLGRLTHLATGKSLHSMSGVAYVRELFTRLQGLSSNSTFWVFGSAESKTAATTWLRMGGLSVDDANSGVTSRSNPTALDHSLLLQVEQQKPNNIVIAFSGGDQERLGLYLREYLVYRPAIHCVGSAVALLSGEQRPIPGWAERNNLGWLIRLCSQPAMLFPRLGMAAALSIMVMRYKSEMPPLRQRWTDV